MTDCGGDHRVLIFKILSIAGFALFLEFTEFFGEVFGESSSYRGLLGDNQSLRHEADLRTRATY